MAYVATGWTPNLPNLPPGTGTGGSGRPLSGVGAPGPALGNNGNIYIDQSTGDIYTKTGDTWVIQSGGGGAVEIIPGVVDDPNVGAIVPADPTKGAIYYKNGVFSLWTWTTAAGPWVALNQ